MKFEETILEGSYVIDLDLFQDNRGWFTRTFSKDIFEKQIRFTKEWVQMNHSFTKTKGAIRGMHFQLHPFSEIKLVRCIAGEVFDVIVDLRKESATLLKWYGIKLSAENKRMIFIPEGFAHGFQTLSDNAELIYHHSEFYNSEAESGIKFDDSAINIQWPLEVTEISERDKNHPLIDSTFKAL
jgi:dTDP-4-dehydrorhamnose 3,5-epimerase